MGCGGSAPRPTPPQAAPPPARPAPVSAPAPAPAPAPAAAPAPVQPHASHGRGATPSPASVSEASVSNRESAPPPPMTEPAVDVAGESVVEDVVSEDLGHAEPCSQQVRTTNELSYAYNKCTAVGKVTAFFPPKGRCFRIIDHEGRWFFYNDTMNYEMCVQVVLAAGSKVEHCDGTTVMSASNGITTVSAVIYPLETLEFLSGSVVLGTVDVYAHPLSQKYYDHLQIISKDAEEELEMVMELPWKEGGDDQLLKLCSEALVRYADLKFLPSTGMFSRLDCDGRFIEPVEVRRPGEYVPCGEENVDAVRGAVLPSRVGGGTLGDSWFVSALSLLAANEARVRRMFASTTRLEKRLGAYRVLLNKDGWWTSVVVDDFLPTVNGVPCYARCIDDPADLWPSLLQKAYAKIHGSYASITGGDTLLALQNFTGAPVYRFDKNWREASTSETRKEELIQRIKGYTDAHNLVVCSVPTGKKATTAVANGLREGYSYALVAVHNFPEHNITLLKMSNPWEPMSPWFGEWREGSSKWAEHGAVQSSCEPNFEARDGTFFVEWSEAANVFDGCGVLYLDENPVYDNRVAGEFENEWPNLVLVVRAKETVEVTLTLSQRDKRGLPLESPDAKLSPILLCVSRAEGNKQCVYQCSSSDPEKPAHGFNFVVGRDIAMKCTFEASETPYFVIPRIHRRGTAKGRRKGFVIGVQSSTSLDEKLDIRFTTLEPACPVFHNCITFAVKQAHDTMRERQLWAPGRKPVTSREVGFLPVRDFHGDAEGAIRDCIAPQVGAPGAPAAATYANDNQFSSREGGEELQEVTRGVDGIGGLLGEGSDLLSNVDLAAHGSAAGAVWDATKRLFGNGPSEEEEKTEAGTANDVEEELEASETGEVPAADGDDGAGTDSQGAEPGVEEEDADAASEAEPEAAPDGSEDDANVGVETETGADVAAHGGEGAHTPDDSSTVLGSRGNSNSGSCVFDNKFARTTANDIVEEAECALEDAVAGSAGLDEGCGDDEGASEVEDGDEADENCEAQTYEEEAELEADENCEAQTYEEEDANYCDEESGDEQEEYEN